MKFAFLLTIEMHWTWKEITSQTARIKIKREQTKGQLKLETLFDNFWNLCIDEEGKG